MNYLKILKSSIFLVYVLMLSSCISKKNILYFQDAQQYHGTLALATMGKIQPNDILSIEVKTLVQESAMAYNMESGSANAQINSLEILRLKGYLVNEDGVIKFPVLGNVPVMGLTLKEVELFIEGLLETGGHLVDPKVTARLLNAKVTILGEVNSPGTYSFSEQFITLPQALGYAGDLTVYGKRDGVLLLREVNGVRNVYHLDLTTANWLNDPTYSIRQNDVIIVNPNDTKVKSAGFVGDVGTALTIVTLLMSSAILLTR